jgi:hypothetical protein
MKIPPRIPDRAGHRDSRFRRISRGRELTPIHRDHDRGSREQRHSGWLLCRSAGLVPRYGLRNRLPVRRRLEVTERGLEFGRVEDERRAELVGGLPHFAEQRREDAGDREQRRSQNSGFGRRWLSRRLRDDVEELLRGEWLGRWQVPDLPVGFGVGGEDYQAAGDVGQVVEGVRLIELPRPLGSLSRQMRPKTVSPAVEAVPFGP